MPDDQGEPPPASDVDRLGFDDLPAAERSLAAAFGDYPLLTALTPTRTRSPLIAASFARLLIRYSLRCGIVHGTRCRGAIACWLPPGREEIATWNFFRSGLGAFLYQLGIRGAWKFATIGTRIEDQRRAVAKPPYWYLNMLGVHPERRQRGLSRTVLRPVFEQADRDRTACVLETQHHDNLAIYRRLGFELLSEGKLTETLGNWILRRPPA